MIHSVATPEAKRPAPVSSHLTRGLCDGRASIPELLDVLDALIEKEGLDAISERGFGDRARPRRFEIGAALNRLRSLRLVVRAPLPG